ncbi:hypothetical protein HUU39_14025 [candidate division KSB1 bacterium]|nr:hypothetical protein [candidate division KSB1 bacterium]
MIAMIGLVFKRKNRHAFLAAGFFLRAARGQCHRQERHQNDAGALQGLNIHDDSMWLRVAKVDWFAMAGQMLPARLADCAACTASSNRPSHWQN